MEKLIDLKINEDIIIEELYSQIKEIDSYKYWDKVVINILKYFNQITNKDNIEINILFSCLIGKIFSFLNKNTDKKNLDDLLLILLENKYIIDSYLNEIYKISFDNSLLKTVKKINNIQKNNNLKIECTKLNNYYIKNERFNNNMGFSLLGLNGNFWWKDKISKKFFENNNFDKNKLNLFDIMIPDSKLFLFKKYGNNIFEINNCLKNTLIFTYVVYSFNEYYNSKLYNDKFKKIYKKHSIKKEHDIYFKYFNSLSSRANLVKLNFENKILEDITTNSNIILNLEKIDNNLIDSTNITNNNKLEIYAIFLETRQSKFIPKLNFNKLKNDKIIKKFEKLIE